MKLYHFFQNLQKKRKIDFYYLNGIFKYFDTIGCGFKAFSDFQTFRKFFQFYELEAFLKILH